MRNCWLSPLRANGVWESQSWVGSTQVAQSGSRESEMGGVDELRIPAAWKRSVRRKSGGCKFLCGACPCAAQVIVGMGVAAGKARTAEPEDGLHLRVWRTACEQLFGDPQVGDTPIGLGESLRDAQSLQPGPIDGCGCRHGKKRVWRLQASGIPCGSSEDAVWKLTHGGLDQKGTVSGQTNFGVQEFHPGGVAVNAPLGLLIGEARQPTQMPPIGAGGITSIGARQLSADGAGHSRVKRVGADTNPGLKMAGACLQHDARFMTLGAHGGDDLGLGAIQVHQDVAGVAAVRIGVEIDVKAVAIPRTQEPYGCTVGEEGSRPQTFTRATAFGDGMDQSDEVQFVRHRRQLAAYRTQGQKKSVIPHGGDCRFTTASCTIDFQRAVNSVLTGCLTQGAHPKSRRLPTAPEICGSTPQTP